MLDAEDARMRASIAFFHLFSKRTAHANVTLHVEVPHDAKLSNRMYVVTSTILLGLAAGASVQLSGAALTDLLSGECFDPPVEWIAALTNGSTHVAPRTPALFLDYHLGYSLPSWRRLAAWDPMAGVEGLLPARTTSSSGAREGGSLQMSGGNRRRLTYRIVSNEWYAPLLLSKSLPLSGGSPVIHGNPAAIGTNVSTVDESSVSSAAAVVATPMRSLVDETNPFDTVAALLYRPLPKITAAVRAITAEMLQPSHTISVHVRAQVKTLIRNS